MTQGALAVVSGKREIDFETFQREIHACALWLNQSLAAEEQRVAIRIGTQYWHWVVTLALLQTGKTGISVYTVDSLPDEIRSTFHVWIADRAVAGKGKILSFPQDAVQKAATSLPVSSEELPKALNLKINKAAKRIILTSGTTGRPKIVSLDAKQIGKRLMAASRQFGLDVDQSTRLAPLMGLDTIGGMLTTMVTWLKGGAVILGNAALTKAFSHQQESMEHQPNLVSASPLRLQQLLSNTTEVWPNRDQCVVRVGGARLNTKVRDDALRLIGSRVQTTYGSTELGLIASCDAVILDQYPGAAGYVYDDAHIEVVDRKGNVLPAGEKGFIRGKSAGMATGYEGDANSKAFRKGWFYSGDIGYLTKDGLLVVSGRDSEIINLGGLKLSAIDLEASLQAIPEIRDVCVFGDLRGNTNLVIAAVPEEKIELAELRPKIKAALPVEAPFILLTLDDLPRNAMGKLKRNLISKSLTKKVLLNKPQHEET